MQFSRPLLRLPIRFSADALARDVEALPRAAWTAHPQRFQGNSAVRLITAGGEPTDVIEGVMGPTPYLEACPAIVHAMREIGSVWGRSRLMALARGAQVPPHIDSHYYWRTHIRIHIPIITNPDVSFTCGGETVHMEPGECWVFDSFRKHEVHNRGRETRVHLVIDTVGGGRLQQLIDEAESGKKVSGAQAVEPRQAAVADLAFERVNVPVIMSPWEMRCHVDFLMENCAPSSRLEAVAKRVSGLVADWAALWAQFGDDEQASGRYAEALTAARRDILALGANEVPLKNGLPLAHVFDRLIAEAAIQAMRRPAMRQDAGLRRAS